MMKRIVVVIVLGVIAYGAYAWYTSCGGFNSCKNPVCRVNCN
jgi:hypothetical protein